MADDPNEPTPDREIPSPSGPANSSDSPAPESAAGPSLVQREHRDGYHLEVKPSHCAECWPSGPPARNEAAYWPGGPPPRSADQPAEPRGAGWAQNAFERLRGRIRVDADDPAEPPPGIADDGLPVCQTCGSKRWLRRDVPPSDPGFGVLIPCQACSSVPEVAASTLRRVFRVAAVPPRFADLSFDTYPVSPQTAVAVAELRLWAADDPRSLVIYGDYSRGKTGLAVSAMRARLERAPTSSLFLPTVDLLDALRATYDPRRPPDAPSESEVLRLVRSVTLLLLDDLGAERPTDWVIERLYGILNYRHDYLLPTIYTTNHAPAHLAAQLGQRIASRIFEGCLVVRLEGPDLRAGPLL